MMLSLLINYSCDLVMVPMRDNVKLATEICKPWFFNPPYLIILVRTPYDRNAVGLNYFKPFITDYKRYILVVQSLRGFQGSEGQPSVFLTDSWGELQDGYDAINWIINQSWARDSVCGSWFSAMGITQYLLSGTGHPNYRCAVPFVGAHSLYHYAAFQGGEFRKQLVENWLNGLNVGYLIDSIANHPSYDNMWKILNLEERLNYVNIPMLHFGGWFDIFIESQVDIFNKLQFYGMPGAKNKQKLIIGPWTHLGFGQVNQGDLSFPNAYIDFLDFNNDLYMAIGSWYDCHLAGKQSACDYINSFPPVKFYIIGLNEWAYSDTFPPRGIYYRNFYLRNGNLITPNYPSENIGYSEYIYNPYDPTPTIGGNELLDPTQAGPKDQSPLINRSDVIVFQTPILTDTLLVIGTIYAKLYILSNRLDTDFSVRVVDVFPDGRKILVTDGIIKARYRYGFDQEVLLNPNQIDSVLIRVGTTAWAFLPGHRLMVIISSANYPRFEANPNNGGPFKRNDPNKLIANNRVYHNAQYPSHIILPIYQTTKISETNKKFYYFKNNQICSIKPFDIYSSNGELLKKNFSGCQGFKKGVYILKYGQNVQKVIF